MQHIKHNEATGANRWVRFRCFDDDSADGYAPKTGLTFASGELKIAKAGSAFANATNYATVVEAGFGWYWYQTSAAEVNTLGAVLLLPNLTDVYPDATEFQVSAPDFNSATSFGLSNLDATVSSRSSHTVADILAGVIETGLTLAQALRGLLAEALGKIGGVGTNTVTARAAITDAKVRVTATLDAQGNRTGVAVDLD